MNFSFAILSYGISIWILANFLGANYKTHDFSLYATRLDFITGCILTYAAWLFSAALLRQANTKKNLRFWYSTWLKVVLLAVAVLSAGATLLPSVIKVSKPEDGLLSVVYGSNYIVFASGLAIIVAGVVVNLLMTQKIARGRMKQQVSVMLTALFISALLVAFANLLLPQLSSSANTNLVGGNLSYLGIVFFIISTFYSIVRHRLFDLRLVLARSAAYLLLVAVLAVGYGIITLFISNTLTTDYELTGRQVIVPIISIVLLVFTVNPLGRFFNKLTSRVFYKDSYEPQQFLGELNQVIISNVDLSILLRNVSNVFEKYLKVYFALFDLHKSEYVKHRVIGLLPNNLDEAKMVQLRVLLKTQKTNLFVTDELVHVEYTLHKLMESMNIAVIVRLSSLHGQELGFMMLGRKKNGSAYTSQDLEMIAIASGELIIAAQNALRFEEIEKFNATLQEKIEDATKRLRQSNTKLRMLDETKDDFISMASHQLRTPLTSVKGYVSMVLDGDAGKISPLQRKLLNQAFISSQRMVYLISDLLNVSRLRTGKFIIEATKSNLADVVKGEIDQLVETAKSRNLDLVYNKPEHFPVLMLDETKLRQVVMNFVDNAIYYTPSGGRIEVTLVDKPMSIELTVVDNGMGVPKPEQHHLFTKFYRANNAKRARPDGTGLGLFMAKKVIIAQGGAIIFRSHEGKGSTFGFSFAKEHLLPPSK